VIDQAEHQGAGEREFAASQTRNLFEQLGLDRFGEGADRVSHTGEFTQGGKAGPATEDRRGSHQVACARLA
jgi:hypothetical protein